MFCQKCGKEIVDGLETCQFCGAKIKKDPSSEIINIENKERELEEKIQKIGKRNWLIFSIAIIFLVAIVSAVFAEMKFGIFGIKGIINNKNEDTREAPISNELTKDEIDKISKSIVFLVCSADNIEGSDSFIVGSGTLIHHNSIFRAEPKGDTSDYHDFYILTNGHVAPIKPLSAKGFDFNLCVGLKNKDSVVGTYSYNQDKHFLDDSADVALMKYADETNGRKTSKPKMNLKDMVINDYSICPANNMVGEKVYIFGYPSSTYKMDRSAFLKVQDESLIVSQGMISGTDSAGNYYTDAKVDAGNSGGLAVSKDNGKICLVGIPTWLTQGSYENLGLIQPFQKVVDLLNTKKDKNEPEKIVGNIDSIDIGISIANDNSADVREIIDYNFEESGGDFAYRDLNYHFSTGDKDISVVQVKDDSGNSLEFETKKDSSLISVRIGTSGKILTGNHKITVDYKVKNLFQDTGQNSLHQNKRKLFWNISAKTAKTKIIFPREYENNQIDFDCPIIYGDNVEFGKENCDINFADKKTIEISSLKNTERGTLNGIIIYLPK